MSLLGLEVRSALRRVARAPAFSAGVIVTLALCIAAMPWKSLARARQARNAEGVSMNSKLCDACASCGDRSPTSTSCCGSGKGSGRRSTPFTTEKMAAVAPTPTASITATRT